MNTQDNFGLDLSTRIAMHNMLLQKLFARLAKEQDNPEQFLKSVERDLLASFEPDVLGLGNPQLTAESREWVCQQSDFGKDLTRQFIEKTSRHI